MNNSPRRLSTILASALALLTALPSSALDLSGKTVTWIVPFKEGGGSDTIARLMQPHLQEALPGKPTVIILNQPGGGSVKAANRFHAKAKTDGTTLIIASTSTFVPVTLQAGTVKYDPGEWRPVMGLPRGKVLYTNPKVTAAMGGGKDPAADVKALQAAELRLGIKTPASAELIDLIALELLGVNPKPIFGLSTGKSRKAFMRGETNINSDGTGPYLQKVGKLREKGEASPIYTYGHQTAGGAIERDPDLADIPTIVEVYQAVHGEAPSGPGFEALKAMAYNNVALSKVIALPKGTPDDVVAAYIEAFRQVAANPDAAAGLKKAVGSLPMSFGDETGQAIVAGTRMEPATRDWIDSLLKVKYDASL